jgi:biopolymer transport protein TolR
MAGFLAAGGSRNGRNGRRGRRAKFRPMAEINVTPMVDVMLVLLIIFMVTAPLLTVGIPVNLPQTKAEPLSNPDEPLVVTVNAKGEIYLQETSIGDEALVPRLQAITANKPDTKIFVRGDKAIDYGRVMQVMGMIKSAGFTQVALVVDMPPDKTQPGQTPAQTQDQKKKTGK